MITEFFMTLGMHFSSFMMDLFPPTDEATDLIFDAQNALGPILSGGAAIGAWLPWDVLALTFTVVMSIYVGAFVLRVACAALAHVPFVGGAG